ncbi:serine/threonine-protein kinase fray2 isoform X1 [Pistacia vera]|uniref:serine/threonine-protein kinase fray2 isoform X1 n=1 Tax=Pistacia vera TaxID=55513 RepID=UPI001263C862|nr:serine/threonine-protein kinase fray2 isoform X1 [Pistacia vera]
MTIDDESSVYVGGLPYNATERTVREVFDLYGSVVAVKIVNDRGTRGKCYGFVTFTNPRSAIDAINDMNGRTIEGRVVRVNEVTTRGGKSNFGRERFRRGDWDKGRDRERDSDHSRDRHWDRYSDRSRGRSPSRDHDRDKERGYEHAHDRDPSRDHFSGRDQDRYLKDNKLGLARDHDQEWETNSEFDQNQDREIDGTNGYHKSVVKGKECSSRKRSVSTINDQHTRELSSNSDDDYNDEVKEQLDRSVQRRQELKKEITQMLDRLDEKERLVSDLQERSKKLEDALIDAKKLSSHRQKQVTKLYRCFTQVNESAERLRSCEQELQSMVDVAMIESDMGDDLGLKDGGGLTNGINE